MVVVVGAVSTDMPSLSTSIAGRAWSCIVAAVVGVAVVVAVGAVVVSLLLVLGRIGPAIFCYVTLEIAPSAVHLPAFAIMMGTALVTHWEISGILPRSAWSS